MFFCLLSSCCVPLLCLVSFSIFFPLSVLALKKARAIAVNTAHVLRLNKAGVVALNKAHVLRLNTEICPVFTANTKEAAFGLSGASLRKPEQKLRKLRITYYLSDNYFTYHVLRSATYYVSIWARIFTYHVFTYYVLLRIYVLRIAYAT